MLKEFGMDIVTKCLEEIISYRTVDNLIILCLTHCLKQIMCQWNQE